MRQGKSHPLRNLCFTRDYNIFSYLPNSINRKIEKPHVKVLTKSMELMGPLRVVICAHLGFLNKNKLYVLDGQHLIEASIIRDEEIAYVIIPIGNKRELIKTIAMLNSSAKNWKVLDYVISWSWLSPDYRTLWQAYESHNIPLSAVVCAYSMLDTRDTNPVKNGDFKIADKQTGDKLCDWLDELYEIIPRSNRMITRMFTETYVEMYYTDKRNYAHTQFKEFVTKNIRHMLTLTESKKVWMEYLSNYRG